MLDPKEFWRGLADARPAILLVVVLESWKEIGDGFGIDAIEFAESLFASIYRHATRGAAASGRLSMSAGGAWWPGEEGVRVALDTLQRWSPTEIVSPRVSVRMAMWWTTLRPTANEAASELYGRLQAEVEAHMQTLPAGKRHRAIYQSWEELIGG